MSLREAVRHSLAQLELLGKASRRQRAEDALQMLAVMTEAGGNVWSKKPGRTVEKALRQLLTE